MVPRACFFLGGGYLTFSLFHWSTIPLVPRATEILLSQNGGAIGEIECGKWRHGKHSDGAFPFLTVFTVAAHFCCDGGRQSEICRRFFRSPTSGVSLPFSWPHACSRGFAPSQKQKGPKTGLGVGCLRKAPQKRKGLLERRRKWKTGFSPKTKNVGCGLVFFARPLNPHGARHPRGHAPPTTRRRRATQTQKRTFFDGALLVLSRGKIKRAQEMPKGKKTF